jgi:hypothetical protein
MRQKISLQLRIRLQKPNKPFGGNALPILHALVGRNGMDHGQDPLRRHVKLKSFDQFVGNPASLNGFLRHGSRAD